MLFCSVDVDDDRLSESVIAGALHNIAIAQRNLGRVSDSLLYLNKSLEMFVRAYGGHDHPDVAQAHTNMARSLQSVGHHAAALVHLNRSLDIYTRVYGESAIMRRLEVADVWLIMGGSQFQSGHLEATIAACNTSLLIYANAVAANDGGEEASNLYVDEEMAIALRNMGTSYGLLSPPRYVEAEEHLSRAIDIMRRVQKSSTGNRQRQADEFIESTVRLLASQTQRATFFESLFGKIFG